LFRGALEGVQGIGTGTADCGVLEAGLASLHLAKNRNGPTGDIPLRFEAELMRFSTREPEKK
ncbi:MAG: DnaB-like helicase C-terminal domain-containing protein, partial [Akkermansia muciniphila]